MSAVVTMDRGGCREIKLSSTWVGGACLGQGRDFFFAFSLNWRKSNGRSGKAPSSGLLSPPATPVCCKKSRRDECAEPDSYART